MFHKHNTWVHGPPQIGGPSPVVTLTSPHANACTVSQTLNVCTNHIIRVSGPPMLGSPLGHVLRTEVQNLLAKGAIELVPLALKQAGFYSRYFLVPKKDGGLRPILDLRHLNRALMRRPFKMLTIKHILAQIRSGDWFVTMDLKDAYFHIQINPRHRPFLRFAFEGQAYQYTVLPFGLSLAPRTFTKCVDAALSPLRQRGVRVLNYLDDWLVLAQSRGELIAHRDLILGHLKCLGLTINVSKSKLSPCQSVIFLGIVLDSVSMRARLTPERALSVRALASSFRERESAPLKKFQKLLGLMAAASPVLRMGLLRMRPLQHWLKRRVPTHAWQSGSLRIRVNHGCLRTLVPWRAQDWYQEGVTMGTISRRKVVFTDASNLGWGALHKGTPASGLWLSAEQSLHINCLEMKAVGLALNAFLSSLRGHHVLVRTDNMSVVAYINHQGGVRSGGLHAMARDLLLWAQNNLSSLRAAHIPGIQNLGADMLSRGNTPPEPTDGQSNIGSVWQGRNQPVRLEKQHPLQSVLLEGQGRVGPRLAQQPPVCFSPRLDDSASHQTGQGERVPSPSGGSSLEIQVVVSGAGSDIGHSSMACPDEERPPHTGEGIVVASATRPMGPPCVALEPVSRDLPVKVLNTISEARAPSTRRLYALKWAFFSSWCSKKHLNPESCEISGVLSFLHELLDAGCSPSTLKVYVAAIAAHHVLVSWPVTGKKRHGCEIFEGC
jgi:hypothetical protein